ncbi:hypothetical protein [Burkholderia oklahomensis]|uniref:Bacteriophage domain protein n=1 Tax=Burkholderia oklahomensis TaxID=342113 RepID=A0AAI8B527_9BURK|nr:hypothetical protein [Burkholderia oklahomensis]AIO65770.1 putative bacteriophage domain protein [Burkholderia oklahomensis]AOI42601.1 hypothetical protein WG70_23810 [Burkholderia oklahomensis EO147]KUY60055.1 hypothetical protein WG70_06705 [Burkholderia oklahomensis EO147]
MTTDKSRADALTDERRMAIILQVIDERDRAEEVGTRLANAVGEFLGVDVGEWSSANDPILVAIEALESRAPRAEVAGAVPEGWKLVPIDPTVEMLTFVYDPDADDSPSERYAALLAAAPQPPSADAAAAPKPAAEPHSDDIAVDTFARVMKDKLAQARAKGRGGWEMCDRRELSRTLHEHIEKGDPRDVANFCMMLWHHGVAISPAQPAAAAGQEAAIYQVWIEETSSYADVTEEYYRERQPSKRRIVYADPVAADAAAALADERAAFEEKFPMPSQTERCGNGYAATGYNAWDAHKFIARWEGWQARAAASQPAAAAGQEAVAWETTHPAVCTPITKEPLIAADWREQGWHVVPLYTTPPAQVATRQGLTDEQIIECAGKYRIDHYGDYSRNASEHTRDLLAFAHALLDGAKQ